MEIAKCAATRKIIKYDKKFGAISGIIFECHITENLQLYIF